MKKIYTGIGSRDISEEVSILFKGLGKFFAKNYILRSGGADGSDKAFEIGCDSKDGQKEIYIPWKNFNDSNSSLYNISEQAEEIAAKFHPYWNNLKQGAKKLHTRNVFQILGQDLKTPTSFILCYTKGGKMVGGTAQALRIAEAYNIPIMNYGLILK